jgi:hypothetical protein
LVILDITDKLRDLSANMLRIEPESDTVGQNLWLITDLAHGLESEAFVSNGLPRILGGSAETADCAYLIRAETDSLVGNDQRIVCHDEAYAETPDAFLIDSCPARVVRVLQQLEGIATAVLLANQLLGRAAFVESLEYVSRATESRLG